MERVTPEALREAAARLGYDWTDEEIARLLPLVERSLAMLDTLEPLLNAEVEPAVQFRVF